MGTMCECCSQRPPDADENKARMSVHAHPLVQKALAAELAKEEAENQPKSQHQTQGDDQNEIEKENQKHKNSNQANPALAQYRQYLQSRQQQRIEENENLQNDIQPQESEAYDNEEQKIPENVVPSKLNALTEKRLLNQTFNDDPVRSQEPSETQLLEKLKEQVQECLDIIVEDNETDASISGLDILVKLMKNILKQPQNEKFRILNRSNKAIQTKLLSLNPPNAINGLLEGLGYAPSGLFDGNSMFVGSYFKGLAQGIRQLEDQSMKLKMLSMSPEERFICQKTMEENTAAQEKIFKAREEQQRAKKAKEEEKRRIEMISMSTRKDNQNRISKTSKGNQLNFGANIMKFQAPPTDQPPCMAKPSFKPSFPGLGGGGG